MTITPGTYLRKRREAAELSLADVAAALSTEPHLPELERVGLLHLIEADEQPASAATIDAIAATFDFDRHVLERLTDLHYHHAGLPEPRLCRLCACSEWDPCVTDLNGSGACSWVAEDLCSACSGPAAVDAIGTPANDAAMPGAVA